MRRIITLLAAVAALGLLFGASQAGAGVVNCFGSGPTLSGDAWYGPCTTTANGGSGFVKFSSNGTTMNLAAQGSRWGSQQVAASWFNGPVSAASGVCVEVNIELIWLSAGATAEHRLIVSANGLQSEVAWPLSAAGSEWRCAAVPPGVTEVWWQLITLISADKPRSLGLVRQRLSWVFPY